jgi:small subunit ribosomal protein S17
MSDETKNSEETTEGADAAAESAAEPEGSAGGGGASVLDPSDSAPPAEETSEGADAPAGDSPDDAPAEEDPAVEDETPAGEEEAPSEEPVAAKEEPAAETSPEDDLPWKERRRLERSRLPHEAGPALSDEERVAQREQARKVKAAERRKERAAMRATKTEGATGTPPAERSPNAAKVRQGVVISDKGQKSITVRIDVARRHPVYEKVVRRSRTLHAHDERNEAGEGDVVRVVETRPLSKTKRWRLVEVVEKAK